MTHVIPYQDLEIDRIAGAWVVTYWLSEDVTLRLNVVHTCAADPDHIIAEVRIKPDEEFRAIHQGMVSVYGLTHLDEVPEEWREMPTVWTREFMAMAQLWAQLNELADFGASVADRYAGEPDSSRDHFFLPTAAEATKPRR